MLLTYLTAREMLRACQRARSPHRTDLHAYNVVSASSTNLDRIHELLQRTYREVRSIVAASEPTEQVALVNIHLLRWSPEQTP